MRILHIAPSYKPAYIYGGTIESIAKLCEALAAAGEDVTVFTTTANGKTELDITPGKEYNVEGVKVIYFRRQTKDHSHISIDLWKQLNRECRNYDAIHIHSWWNLLVMGAAFICKRKKVKPVISPHGMLSDYIMQHSNTVVKKLMYLTGGKNLLLHSFLHATSEAEFAECKKLIPGWRGSVVPNILSLPPLNMYKKENPVFTILFLSRIHPKKGIELLMEALSVIKTDVRIAIAGASEDDYIHELKKKAKKLGINKQIEWLGWVDRILKFEILMLADLLALTSYNENFANVVIESLHAGTPVLLSREVGLSGFVKENDLGWICALEPKNIAEKIEAAIGDIEKRKRINHCAPSIIQTYFSAEKLVPQYLQLYNS